MPAADYAGTPYSPQSAPATLTVPTVVAPPRGANDNFLFADKGNPTVALFTAQVTPQDYPTGLEIECTLPTTQRGICDASLRFFLADQSGTDAEVGSDNLGQIEAAVAAFVSEH